VRLTATAIPTEEIPQADRLDRVVETARLVRRGRRSYQAIASEIGFTERQGRYYRRAAETLGLIKRVSTNVDAITPFGKQVVESQGDQWKTLLAKRVAGLPAVQPVLAILSTSPVTDTKDLINALSVATKTTRGMVERRLSTILSWLETSGVVEEGRRGLQLVSVPQELIALPDPLPILPKVGDLKAYREVPIRRRQMASTITYEVDEVKRERASATHERLRALLAKRIKEKCAVTPTTNRLIDLATSIKGLDYIVEVKSTTKNNVRSQVRRGLSQLYEYRYLYATPSAKLVLLLENRLKNDDEWLVDYLTEDRELLVVWDGQDDELFTTDEGRKTLPFL